MGIGSDEGGPVPDFATKSLKMDDDENLVISKLNIEFAQNLISQCGGKLVRIDSQYPDLNPLLTEINLNASRDLRNLDWKIVRRLFSAPLIMALFAFMLYILAPPFIPKRR